MIDMQRENHFPPFIRDFYFHFLGPNRYKDLVNNDVDPLTYTNKSVFDSIEKFSGLEEIESVCHVRWVFLGSESTTEIVDKPQCLIVSEINKNPGASISISWEVLLTQLINYLKVEENAVTVIEHYGSFSYGDVARPELFSKVNFRPFLQKEPAWRGDYAVEGRMPCPGEKIASLLEKKKIEDVHWPFASSITHRNVSQTIQDVINLLDLDLNGDDFDGLKAKKEFRMVDDRLRHVRELLKKCLA